MTPSTLPIISIAPFLANGQSNTQARAAASTTLHNACVSYGFFYLDISAYVNPSEPEELTTLARQFFTLPQEEKDKLSLKNQDYARGYARLRENVTNGKADNHEGIDFYRPVENSDKTKPLWGENQWPEIPEFKEKYNIWIEKMKMLGMIVMEAMANGLGMTREEWQELRGQVDDSFWVMRIIGYPPLPNDHDGFSCGAHKYDVDYGCLTFLHADPTPSALQVFLRKPGLVQQSDVSGLPDEQGGDEGVWINADPIPGCIVCNIGEISNYADLRLKVWEVWTNGLYRSTLHRVVHRGSNYRIPFFYEPNFDATVKPLDAARRIKVKENIVEESDYPSVIYGNFLVKKVGNNFTGESGRYDN
ncbi:hypothetical protein BDQ17DRAFT_1231904 [Cyathus striatus]|nr:hypothetical protein BDQ17DRAFT_1231904 [Cyathus striatus]